MVRLFRARRSLLIENLALRQQLAAIRRKHPRSQLGRLDKLFWVVIRQFWSQWKKALIVVTPETVVRWHQAGFRLCWRLISKVKKPIGRRQTPKCGSWSSGWLPRIQLGAPRIHGELLMLGFDISQRTISRWMKQAPRDSEPAKRWSAFLKNHREAIAAMDFFTVPTITFGVLYCLLRHRSWSAAHPAR
jgi:putative transposase